MHLLTVELSFGIASNHTLCTPGWRKGVMLYFQRKDQWKVTRWPNKILQSHLFSPFHYHMFLNSNKSATSTKFCLTLMVSLPLLAQAYTQSCISNKWKGYWHVQHSVVVLHVKSYYKDQLITEAIHTSFYIWSEMFLSLSRPQLCGCINNIRLSTTRLPNMIQNTYW